MTVNEFNELLREHLTELGIGENCAIVFLFLQSSEKKLTAGEIANNLQMNRMLVYRIVEKLRGIGLVRTSTGKPMRFFTSPYDDVMEALYDIETSRTKAFTGLRDLYNQLKQKGLLEGTKQIHYDDIISLEQLTGHSTYLTARRISKKSRKVCVVGQVRDITYLYNRDFFDTLKGECRLLISTAKVGRSYTPEVLAKHLGKYAEMNEVGTKVTDLDVQHFIVCDDKVLIFTDPYERRSTWGKVNSMLTNSPPLVKIFRDEFERLYNNPVARSACLYL